MHTGRGRGIRTPDSLLPKQVRYQTALYPAERTKKPGERHALTVPGYSGELYL